MNRLAYTCLPLVAFVTLASAPEPAIAQTEGVRVADKDSRGPSAATKRKAKRFVDAGLVHQEQGEYEEAIRWFRKAYELIPHPQLLYNIGLAHRQAGHRQSALDYFRQYLDREPGGQWHAEASAAIAEMEAELQNGVDPETEALRRFDDLHAAVGRELDEFSTSAGADAAATFRDRYGDIDAARAREKEGTRRAATRSLRALRTEMRAAREAAEKTASNGDSQAPGAPAGSLGGGPVDNPGSAGRGSRMTGWVLIGVGSAALAVAGVSGLEAQSIAKQLSLPDNFGPWTDEELALDRDGRAAAQRALIAGAVGAVAVTAGIVFYMRGRSAAKRARQAVIWSPSVRDGQLGVTLSGTF